MKTKSTIHNIRYGLSIIVASLTIAGCSTPIESYKGRSLQDVRVALAPGDQIEIRFFYNPELNDLQHIRPDGKITLQLLGDVKAAGLTPAQLQTHLEEQFEGLVEKPSVAVIARELVHRNVYVSGAVFQPGLQPMPGHTTALQAIMTAGGFDMTKADTSEILIIRHENGSRKLFLLDFKDMLSGKEKHQSFYLHAQDIVYVPRTGIVKTAQWIDQYITQMIPKTGFSLFYDTGSNNSVIGVDTTSKY